jgi:hypothetical protein
VRPVGPLLSHNNATATSVRSSLLLSFCILLAPGKNTFLATEEAAGRICAFLPFLAANVILFC